MTSKKSYKVLYKVTYEKPDGDTYTEQYVSEQERNKAISEVVNSDSLDAVIDLVDERITL